MLITPSMAIVVAVLSWFDILQGVEWLMLDQVMRLRAQEPMDERITLITIDESDRKFAQQWPISDQLMAQMIYNLAAHEPKVIGLNLYREIPVAPGREALTRAFQEYDNIIGIEKVLGDRLTPPSVLAELDRVAAADLIVDRDGKVRRGFLTVEQQQGFGARLAEAYLTQERLGLDTTALDTELPNISLDQLGEQFGQTPAQPLRAGDRGYVSAQVTLEGKQTLLNYRGGLDAFQQLSFQDVIENQIPDELIRDRLVIVGAISPSLNELLSTPYSSQLLQPMQQIPSVVIHGTLASQIISHNLDDRPLLRPISNLIFHGFIIITAAAGAIVTKLLFCSISSILRAVLITVAGLILIFVLSIFCMTQGLVVPVFTPWLALCSTVILVANYEAQKRLKRINSRLAIANKKLEDYSQDLEQEVGDRTRELSNTLKDLKAAQTSLVQVEKMAALGQMVAGIAHEINNPINYIAGNVRHATEYVDDLFKVIDLCLHKYRDGEINQYLEEVDLIYIRYDFYKLLESITKGAARVEDIVKSLKTFSHLDEANLKQVDLAKDLDSVLLMINSRLLEEEHQQITIKVEHHSGQLPLIQCYAAKVNQVLLDILNNAIDAIQFKGSQDYNYQGEIIVQTQLIESQKVVIKVLDNGVGVAEDLIPKIFDPFFTTKPVGKGTGLGLAIAHSVIVEQHHGSLDCRRIKSGGTEFTITLPVIHQLYHGHLAKV